jgi:hypothetical protein
MKDRIDAKEIEELIRKIEPLVKRVELDDERAREMFENMEAYIEDSKYFLKNGNFVKSFEAIVWAWSILELCEKLKIFKIKKES